MPRPISASPTRSRHSPSLRAVRCLLAYLGFPYFDTATLPLLQGEGLDEFDPIKVDRIAPDDATSIRSGGAEATLKGIQFGTFGAFFSRAYRENDYLWGRLHGAERMIDITVSNSAAHRADETGPGRGDQARGVSRNPRRGRAEADRDPPADDADSALKSAKAPGVENGTRLAKPADVAVALRHPSALRHRMEDAIEVAACSS